MIRIFAIFAIYIVAGTALAQFKATTTGPNSPSINTNSGDVKVVYVNRTINNVFNSPAAKIDDAVKNENDPLFLNANKMVARGDYQEALKELTKFSFNSQQTTHKLALAKYVEGQIRIYNEQLDLADIAFGTALDLQPENCSFRFSKGISLLSVGRLWDAIRLLSNNNTGTSTCFASGTPEEKANLYLLSARTSYDLRDKEGTLHALDKAYQELIQANSNKSAWVEPACMFVEIVNSLPKRERTRWQNHGVNCQKALATPRGIGQNIAAERFRFYQALIDQSGQALSIGIQLQNEWTYAEEIEWPGVDIVRKRYLYGNFISDLGMQYLWTGNDLETAAQLYRKAFVILEPLLNSGRNATIVDLMQLIIRIKDLEMMSVTKVFPNTTDRFREALSLARKRHYSDGSYSSCVALNMINTASYGVTGAAVNSLDIKQADDCYRRAVPPESWTAIRYNFEKVSAMADGDQSIQSLERRIMARAALFGFPSDRNVHAEQGFDLYLLSKYFERESNSENKNYVETIDRSVIEAGKGFPDGVSGYVISMAAMKSKLPFTQLNPIVQKQLDLLESQSETSVSGHNHCFSQVIQAESSEYILAYALKFNISNMIKTAANLWSKNMPSVDLCTDISVKFTESLKERIQLLRFDYGISKVIADGKIDNKQIIDSCNDLPVCNMLLQNDSRTDAFRNIFSDSSPKN